MFCVECGREGPTVRGLCPDCFRERHPLVRPPEAVDVVRCAHCGRLQVGGGWTRAELDAAVPAILGETVPRDPRSVEGPSRVGSVRFTHSARREDDRNYALTVKASALVEGVEIVEPFHVRLRVRPGVCPTCSRQRGSYYEAILQVRASGRRLTEAESARAVRFIEDAVERRAGKGEEVFVSKVEAVRGGPDVYLSSSLVARALARDLARELGATVGSSPKIAGRKDGKDLYRVTYVVRIGE